MPAFRQRLGAINAVNPEMELGLKRRHGEAPLTSDFL